MGNAIIYGISLLLVAALTVLSFVTSEKKRVSEIRLNLALTTGAMLVCFVSALILGRYINYRLGFLQAICCTFYLGAIYDDVTKLVRIAKREKKRMQAALLAVELLDFAKDYDWQEYLENAEVEQTLREAISRDIFRGDCFAYMVSLRKIVEAGMDTDEIIENAKKLNASLSQFAK